MPFLPSNLLGVQAATGFDYPPGLYLFQVAGSEIRANSDGDGQRLLVDNRIVMGPGTSRQFEGRKLANSYQLSEKGKPFLKRFYLSCGITEEFINQNGGNVDSDWLTNRQFVAQVVKNGNYTNITNERPISEWNNGQSVGSKTTPAVAQAPAQSPQPAMLQPAFSAAPPPQQFSAPGYAPPQQFAAPPQQYSAPPQGQQLPPAQQQYAAQPQQFAAPPPQAAGYMPQPAPQGMQPALPQPQMGAMPAGIPTPVPPAGRIGQ